MKILVNCSVPSPLAHGGMQIQIEQTKATLEACGVEVDHLRWWNTEQTGEILHQFGALPPYLIRLAQNKGFKVIQTAFLGGLGAKPGWKRGLQKIGRTAITTIAPSGLRDALGWEAFRTGDACVAMTEWEAHLLKTMYGVEESRLHVVPNGVENIFFESAPGKRGSWLVCTATIVGLKQVLKLAQSAVAAKTPIWIIGKPFSPTDPYALEFQKFARENSGVVRYEGPILDRAKLAGIYREARGFVLLSRWETLSLSALEAAACECPLLLSDLPWARTVFKETVAYCPIDASIEATAARLRQFYDAAPGLKPPPKPLTWMEVALKLKQVYEQLLKQR
jgi:glycosyltransferase involved in cell wall biosynthesis